MRIVHLILSIIFLSVSLSGQLTPVPTTILNDDIDGFEFIDPVIRGVRLIGIGEATHGTKEFKTLQCNLFKYLVENHDYNTFFLEDEYVNGLSIDQYIRGGSGHVDSLIAGIRNWPWKTPQLKSLITWMRAYNKIHKDALSFVGVDFQEEEKLKHHLESEYNIMAVDRDITEIAESLSGMKDKGQVYLFLQALKVWSNGDRRDDAMAQVIIKYLERHNESKGVFVAHNAHLLKIYHDNKNDEKDRAWAAGGLLDRILKEQYYALVTDFDYGEFYAYSLKDDRMSRREIDNHEFAVNTAGCPDKKFSLCHILKNELDDIIFVSDLDKYKATKKWIHVNSIGASYYRKKNGERTKYTSSYLKPEHIDAFVFFKKTSAATILRD